MMCGISRPYSCGGGLVDGTPSRCNQEAEVSSPSSMQGGTLKMHHVYPSLRCSGHDYLAWNSSLHSDLKARGRSQLKGERKGALERRLLLSA